MTPTLTTSVWNGFPTIRVPMVKQFHGGPVFGGTYPALLWRAFTQPALAGTKVHDWAAPGRGRGRRGAHRSRDRPARRAQLPARALGRDGLLQDADDDVALHRHGDPDARGDERTSEHQAQVTLDRAGLLPEIVQAVPPAGEPAGKVFAQDPPPGEPIELGGRVQVSIAKPVTWVTVPDLIGLNDVAARSALRVAGFKVRETRGAYGKPAGPRLLAVPDPAQAGREGRARHADRERRNGLT